MKIARSISVCCIALACASIVSARNDFSATKGIRSIVVPLRSESLDNTIKLRGGNNCNNKGTCVPAKTCAPAAAHAVHEGEMSVGVAILSIIADLCPHGMLPVAFGMASGAGTGILAAPAILAVFGVVSAYTLISFGRSAQKTGKYSFSGVWAQLIGPGSAWIVEVAMAVMCFGCCVFYSAFIGDLFHSLAGVIPGIPELFKKRAVDLCLLSVFPLLPLCLLKNLSALQYTSFSGLVAILYTVWFVAHRAFDGSYSPGGKFFEAIDLKYRNPFKDSFKTVGLWQVNSGSVTLVNMCCVAFMCHYNGIKYYEELKKRSVKRYTAGVGFGVLGSFAVFVCMMLMGFKTFGPSCQALLLNNYHKTDDSLATLARFACGCAILCGYPLMFAALKTSFFSAAHELTAKFKSTKHLSNRFLTDTGLQTFITVALLGAVTAIGCNKGEEDVAVVVGLIGALLGGSANFIIPALLNLKLLRIENKKMGLISLSEASINRAIIVLGAVIMVVGTASTIGDAKHGHHH